MTVPQGPTGYPVDTTGTEHSPSASTADTASSEASNVVSTAGEGAKQTAGEASTQVKVVADQARQEFDSLMSQTRDEVRRQADSRNAQAAERLRTLSDEVTALAEGRPDEAGPLVGLLHDAQQKVSGYAERLENGGTQGLIDDVSSFARRRPGLFLAGAIGAGFVVGRLVRAGSASGQHDDQFQRQDELSDQFDTSYQPSAMAPVMGDDPYLTGGPVPDAAGPGGVGGTLPPLASATTAEPSGLPLTDTPRPGTSA